MYVWKDNNRTYPRRISTEPKKAIHQIRPRVLRRPYNCPEEPQNNGDQPTPQRPSRHQQDVIGGKTLLVAENHRGYTKELRPMYPMQNVL